MTPRQLRQMKTLLDLREPKYVTVGQLKAALAEIPDDSMVRLVISEMTAPCLCVASRDAEKEVVIGDNLEQQLIRE